LQQVRDDERAQNALGVALWFCGQKEEAIDRFRRAAANGNEDAKTNLRELKIE
jgi:Flp pilus assembly protein TadD